jgi:hypothetical protein
VGDLNNFGFPLFNHSNTSSLNFLSSEKLLAVKLLFAKFSTLFKLIVFNKFPFSSKGESIAI